MNLTIHNRLEGVRVLLQDLDEQANKYRLFLIGQSERAEKGASLEPQNEPPAITKHTMKLIDEELGQLNNNAWGKTAPPSHLFHPYSTFGPSYASLYKGPTSLLGGKTLQSLAHDYTGITVWISQTLAYTTYLRGYLGSTDCTTEQPQTP